MLKSLDLFSGIGGLTHALSGLACPVSYCEKDPVAVCVLEKLMKQGKLPRAPINRDVCTLKGAPLKGKVDLIVGGVPCFVAGTLVNTYDGLKPIEAVRDEDMVLSHTGTWRRIQELQRTLIPPGCTLYHIDNKYHHCPVTCTEEHPFYARVHGNKPEFVAAKDLTPKHFVGMPIDTRSEIPTFHMDMPHGRTKTTVLDEPSHWWMMGYYLGNGRTTHSRGGTRLNYAIVFAVAHKHEDIIAKKLMQALRVTKGEVNQGCTKYCASSKAWWTILQDFGKYAHGKKVPDWVMAAPIHLLTHFFEGYMAADGSKRSTRSGAINWRMGTVSVDIALGMQRVTAKLGKIFSVKKYTKKPTAYILGRKIKQRDSFEISGIMGDLQRTRRATIEDGYVWYPIQDITTTPTTEDQWVYNFEIETDNSYCVYNRAVHNCVGFSSAGKHAGFDNEQSGLYKHVVRLVREIQPPFLFLENVPGILRLGIRKVSLTMSALGYQLWWVVIPAYGVGAPQHRHRWFCLGVRPSRIGTRLTLRSPWAWYAWNKEPVPRMVLGSSADPRRRIPLLGNAVVPDCARMAFLMLWTGCHIDAKTLRSASTFLLKRPSKSVLPNPKYGAFLDRKQGQIGIEGPRGLKGPPTLDLVADPTVFGDGKKTPKMTSGIRTRPMHFSSWGTPRHSIGYSGVNALTHRCAHDLGTQLRFERRTPTHLRPGFTNPVWVEWLMGFPLHWTTC